MTRSGRGTVAALLRAMFLVVWWASIVRAEAPPELELGGFDPVLQAGGDRYLGPRAGARYGEVLGFLLFNSSEYLLQGRLSTPWLRLLKLVAVDLALASWTVMVIHEVFGHSARGRELGVSGLRVRLGLPAPYVYVFDNSYLGLTGYLGTLSPVENQLFSLGGFEASAVASDRLAESMVDWREVRLNPGDTYGLSRGLLLLTALSAGGGSRNNDVNAVLEVRAEVARQTGRAVAGPSVAGVGARALLNLVDPLLLQALWLDFEYLATGAMDRPLAWPLPVVPRFGYALVPFGERYVLDLLMPMAPGTGWLGFEVLSHERPDSALVRVDWPVRFLGTWTLATKVGLVREVDPDRTTFLDRRPYGRVRGIWRSPSIRGWFGELEAGWKTRGYEADAPLGEGFLLGAYLGYRFAQAGGS